MPKTQTKAATANIYAIVGSDEAEVKRVARALAQKLTPSGAGDFGLEIIDGAADNAEQAAARIRSTVEALQTLPFFGNAKVVWLKNVNFMGDNQLGRAAGVHTALEELADVIAAGLAEGITLLVSAIEVDKRRSFYKTLSKRAELGVFDKLDSSRSGWEEDASELVQRLARKRKLQFENGALELFVLRTGGDTRQIENELEKIDICLGEKRRGRCRSSPVRFRSGACRRRCAEQKARARRFRTEVFVCARAVARARSRLLPNRFGSNRVYRKLAARRVYSASCKMNAAYPRRWRSPAR